MTRKEQHKKRKRKNKGNYYYYSGSTICAWVPYVHSLPILSTNTAENWLGTIGNIYDFSCAPRERHLIIEED